MARPNVNVVVGGYQEPSYTYKKVVLKNNISFASQIGDENCRYVVKWDFDLSGESVTIPANCVLEFCGGSLNNGTIDLENQPKIYPDYNSLSDGVELIISGYPAAGTTKFANKPLWSTGEAWVDALGNDPDNTVYPKVIGEPTDGNLAMFNGTDIEDSGNTPTE